MCKLVMYGPFRLSFPKQYSITPIYISFALYYNVEDVCRLCKNAMPFYIRVSSIHRFCYP
jgi:hypothetical protein